MSAVEAFPGTRVLAVGDVMLDEYVWGHVDRVSPEAPVAVVAVDRRSHVAGGAANVATGVVSLGGSAALAGVVGDDAGAASLLAALEGAAVDASGLVTDAGRPTTVKTRVIAQSQQMLRVDSEDRAMIAPSTEADLLRWVHEHIGASDAIVLSDYGKGVVSEAVAQGVIAAARAAGRPVVVDSKGLHFQWYRGATVITPNQNDAAKASRVIIESDADLEEAAQLLIEACEGAALLITRGARGMSLFRAEGTVHVPTVARDVFDVTGAGDTVVATLAVGLGCGLALEDAIRVANAAAGVVVGKVGTATVSLEELRRAL